MAYRRRFELSINKNETDIRAAIERAIAEGSVDMQTALKFYDENFEYFTGEHRNWDDNQADMRELSKKFPEVVFTLHIEGDSIIDYANEYYLNGRMQVATAEVTYEQFDEAQLDDGETDAE